MLRRLDLETIGSGELQYATAYIRMRADHARDVGHDGTAWMLAGLPLVVDEERGKRAAESARKAAS